MILRSVSALRRVLYTRLRPQSEDAGNTCLFGLRELFLQGYLFTAFVLLSQSVRVGGGEGVVMITFGSLRAEHGPIRPSIRSLLMEGPPSPLSLTRASTIPGKVSWRE